MSITDSGGVACIRRVHVCSGVKSVTDKPVEISSPLPHRPRGRRRSVAVDNPGGARTSRKILLGRKRTGVSPSTDTDLMRINTPRSQLAAETDAQKKATLQQRLSAANIARGLRRNFPLQAPSVTVSTPSSLWSGNKGHHASVDRSRTASDLVVYVYRQSAPLPLATSSKSMVG